jgi:hypothetical protein
MKVKLVFPPRVPDMHWPAQIPPLGLVKLYSHLRERGVDIAIDDLDVRVFHEKPVQEPGDKNVLNPFLDVDRVMAFVKGGEDEELRRLGEWILGKTRSMGFDVFGFSILNESNFSALGTSLVMAALLKEDSDCTTVFGGMWRFIPQMLHTGVVDYVIKGNGEEPLFLLCKSLSKGNADENSIPGLNYLKDGRLQANRIWIYGPGNLQKPDFSGLELDMYRFKPVGRGGGKGVLILPYDFSYGCVFNCAFCPHSNDNLFLIKQPGQVADELAELTEAYDTRFIFFMDTNINPGLKYTDRLLAEFEAEGLEIMWSACACIQYASARALSRMRENGAVRLIFGLETGSQKMIDFIGRRISVGQAEKTLEKSHELGIWTEIELIAGMPYEDDEDVSATIRFIKRNKRNIDFAYLHQYQLKDGSRFLSEPEKLGLTNIQDATPQELYLTSEGLFPRRFDETEGLKWDEKREQIVRSFNRVHQVLQEESVNASGSDIHSLFYAYSFFDNAGGLPSSS